MEVEITESLVVLDKVKPDAFAWIRFVTSGAAIDTNTCPQKGEDLREAMIRKVVGREPTPPSHNVSLVAEDIVLYLVMSEMSVFVRLRLLRPLRVRGKVSRPMIPQTTRL